MDTTQSYKNVPGITKATIFAKIATSKTVDAWRTKSLCRFNQSL